MLMCVKTAQFITESVKLTPILPKAVKIIFDQVKLRTLPLRESTTVLRPLSSASTPTEERMALMSLAEGFSLPPRDASR